MPDVRRLEDVFWEEVLEEQFEQYEFIGISMEEESGKRMECQRMMLPVISTRYGYGCNEWMDERELVVERR